MRTPAHCHRPAGRTTALAVLVFLTGCATLPDRVEPEGIEVPERWTARPGEGPVGEGWLGTLQTPELEDLVEEALAHNHDLQAAAARVRQAGAAARIAKADRLPAAGASLAGDRRKINQFGPQETGGVRFDTFDLGLAVDWELDLWAKLADRGAAARATFQASEEDYAAARLSLAGRVAKGYFNLLEARRQLEIAQANATSFTENEAILRGRFERGLSTGLDLQLVSSAAASARAATASRERALDATARTLEILLGRYPANEIGTAPDFPGSPGPVPASLPSELLLRRPDLRAAERRVAAAFSESSAARKELLPSISLTASGGTSTREFEDLLDENFSVWNLAANALQPVFQGGRIVAGIAASEAAADEALAVYRSAALEAFREVETALAAEAVLEQEVARFVIAVEAAALAEDQAWEQYANGTADILTALSAQRTLAAESSRLAAARNQRLQNRIDLHLALGGPFEPLPPPPQPAATAATAP